MQENVKSSTMVTLYNVLLFIHTPHVISEKKDAITSNYANMMYWEPVVGTCISKATSDSRQHDVVGALHWRRL